MSFTVYAQTLTKYRRQKKLRLHSYVREQFCKIKFEYVMIHGIARCVVSEQQIYRRYKN